MADHGFYIIHRVHQYKDNIEKFITNLEQKYNVQEWHYNQNFSVLCLEIRRPPLGKTIWELAERHFNEKKMFEPVHVLFSYGEPISYHTNGTS